MLKPDVFSNQINVYPVVSSLGMGKGCTIRASSDVLRIPGLRNSSRSRVGSMELYWQHRSEGKIWNNQRWIRQKRPLQKKGNRIRNYEHLIHLLLASHISVHLILCSVYGRVLLSQMQKLSFMGTP